jgi:hypothetical protein
MLASDILEPVDFSNVESSFVLMVVSFIPISAKDLCFLRSTTVNALSREKVTNISKSLFPDTRDKIERPTYRSYPSPS